MPTIAQPRFELDTGGEIAMKRLLSLLPGLLLVSALAMGQAPNIPTCNGYSKTFLSRFSPSLHPRRGRFRTACVSMM